ncbi:MAG: extracellular solute-binding protein [Anaerolineae bacterium]|nr:extracellular solute-binding protein [Anaerolineae bacterium]
MSKFSKLLALTFVLALVLGAFSFVASAQEPVVITWFIGVGTGGNPEQIEMQEAVVAAFNEAHDDIQIEMIVVENNVSVETLGTLIATGQAPDIVGPAGFEAANGWRGNWLPLDDLVASTGYDLSQFPEAAVDAFRDTDGLLYGLPLANYPAFLWYRPALFDEAGLEYPPAAYETPYVLDGEEVVWDVWTLREVAMRLTVDANGYDATEEEFDPENVVQWGFKNMWAAPMRQNVTMFGSGELYDGETSAVMPEYWREGFHWLYDGIWTDHFIPSAAQDASDLLAAGNAFASGNLAMTQTHLWYTCCIDDAEWDAAALPSYNGVTTSRIHGDTFRIMNMTEHPEEAFEVLVYLTGDASLDLLSVYGGMPARPEDQEAFFATLDEKYPQGVNWDVVVESLNYTESPQHEAWMPNYNEADAFINAFESNIESTPGLDIDAEIDTMLEGLQVIFDDYFAGLGEG